MNKENTISNLYLQFDDDSRPETPVDMFVQSPPAKPSRKQL